MLSKENYKLLKSYCTPRAPEAEERFEQLKNQNLIMIYNHGIVDLGNPGKFLAPDKWVITELGKDALAEFEEYHDTIDKQLEAFQNIANSAIRRANLAESEARSAKKDAKFSKVLSILSLAVGIGSLIVAILALVLR